MALTPAANDTTGQAALRAGDYNTGAAGPSANPLVARVARRLAARFGLTSFEIGRINNVAQKLLDDAGGDSEKVKLDSARDALVKLLGPL